jgi:pyruvate/2-oxoglutarate/acetoin dehydrogenase E1 component
VYSPASPTLDGREVLLRFFEKAFERDPRIFTIGEDVGKIGDVNQGMAGMQEKFGELRVTDTGIRECTILGQGIGAAMRGLRPIVEIQYLDYLLYALEIMSDDLATLLYRTYGGQKAPCIVRTRGHRLEGIWHSGSPMGTIVNALRGMHVCVPRNMTQAAAMYHTLLQSDEPGLVIERLNGYRSKEVLPDNIGEISLPLGLPEILKSGTDISMVTYGACVYIALEAIESLEKVGISCELIDVQTLLPFDINHTIGASIARTNRVLFIDEDVPGGATAYMLQQVIDGQSAYFQLDSKPQCLSAQAHRPAYGTDGDYFSKPSAEDIFDKVYSMMQEAYPAKFPSIY